MAISPTSSPAVSVLFGLEPLDAREQLEARAAALAAELADTQAALEQAPAGYFVIRASLWALAILVVSVPLAIARYQRS